MTGVRCSATRQTHAGVEHRPPPPVPAGGAIELPLFTPRAGGGPRTPLAVTRRESPARHVTAAEGGLRAAPHTGRSRAKPGLARRVPALVPRRSRAEGAPLRPSGPLRGPAAQQALVPRRGRRKAAPGLRHGPQGAASSGPARRPSPGTRLAASRWSTFRCSSPSSRSWPSPLASRSPGWSRRRRSRRGSSWRVTWRATAARLAPRRSPTRITTRRPTREAAKEGKQLLRRRPAATRRRGDRMGSAISGTPRSGPQGVKGARSARPAGPCLDTRGPGRSRGRRRRS